MSDLFGNSIFKADLHTHTVYSDGSLTPALLVKKAAEAGLSCISVTDHDNTDGIDEAIEAGLDFKIEVIPGVELSVDVDDHEAHILGYYIDYTNENFKNYLKDFRTNRIERAKKIVEKLNDLKVPLKYEYVEELAGGNVSVGRPHIALALQKHKLVENYYSAFARYLADDRPAYVRKYNMKPNEAIELISKAGGLSFIAHPGKTVRTDEIFELINDGLDGIEVVHPSHSIHDTSYLQAISGQYFLLESGGSDYHGTRINEEKYFGKYCVSEKNIIAMKRRLFN
jgi:hypothetical protein